MTVRILDLPAAATHQVMMVVVGMPLEPRRMPGGFDLSDQIGRHTRRQNVIDGLFGKRPQAFAHALMDLIRGGVGMTDQPFEHGMARRGDPQAALA